jgi:hypothetical protein
LEGLKAYHHRKMNICQGLFIYLSITLDKLPAWYDFWSLERKGCKRLSPDISKHHLTDLEAFDWYYQRECARAVMHMKLLYGEEVGSEDKKESSDGEQHNHDTTDIEDELRFGTLGEIFSGPRDVSAELEAIVIRLSNFHQPNIEELESMLNELEESGDCDPGLSSCRISRNVKSLVRIGRIIRQDLEEHLGKQLGSEELREGCCNIDDLIKKALEFKVCVDRIYSDVTTMIEGALKVVEDKSR